MSEKFERMNYYLTWTATVYLQTMWNSSDDIGVTRRKCSAFVSSDKPSSVEFVVEQFPDPDAVETTLKKLHGVKLDSLVSEMFSSRKLGWKLVCSAPIYVERIRMVSSLNKEEKISTKLPLGACEGFVVVPLLHSVSFDLMRLNYVTGNES